MEQEIDAWVEDYFSKFDKEEESSTDSSSEKQEEGSEDSEGKDTQKEWEETDSKDSTKKEAEKDTPFHEHPRWKEVQKERKTLRSEKAEWQKEREEMSKRLNALENKPKTDEEIDAMTPREAIKYQRELMESENTSKSNLTKKEDEEAERYVEETLSDLKDAWHKFDENKLLKLAEDYTEWDIEKAFDLYQKFGESKKKWATESEEESAKKKAAQSNSWNRGNAWKVSWFVSWTEWGNLDLK